MYRFIIACMMALCLLAVRAPGQHRDDFGPDQKMPDRIPGYTLVWHDEFIQDGRPDPQNWTFEHGFVRNEELQWYQSRNAYCKNGLLVIEGRRAHIPNPDYRPGSSDWRHDRPYAHFTSACMTTQGLHQFGYGRFVFRARIDTAIGAWPAIWFLGTEGPWPVDGEIDLMEFYRVRHIPTLLANVAWGSSIENQAVWNTQRKPLRHFTSRDKDWAGKFHIWRMDRNKDSISLYLDNELLNTTRLNRTINPDGSNPFAQTEYLLVNLALGQNGGDPEIAAFPIRLELDYVRYYKKDQSK